MYDLIVIIRVMRRIGGKFLETKFKLANRFGNMIRTEFIYALQGMPRE